MSPPGRATSPPWNISVDFFKALFPLPDQVKLVGHEPIHAKVGDDVILPCRLMPPYDVNHLIIEWRFKDRIIHVHRGGSKDDETSDPEYKGRTSLFHDEFEKGDISLKLTNVTKEDEGNYICFVPKLESNKLAFSKQKGMLKLFFLFVTGPHPGVIGVFDFVLPVAVVLTMLIIINYVVHRQKAERNKSFSL
uniref:Ig-like domain-containing protein n=1 Tax=Poecilia latipinna TaxID=48699 RepID=A0A3B3VT03_9TELE